MPHRVTPNPSQLTPRLRRTRNAGAGATTLLLYFRPLPYRWPRTACHASGPVTPRGKHVLFPGESRGRRGAALYLLGPGLRRGTLAYSPGMIADRVRSRVSNVSSTLDHTNRQPTFRGFLIFVAHVTARLQHGDDDRVEADDMGAICRPAATCATNIRKRLRAGWRSAWWSVEGSVSPIVTPDSIRGPFVRRRLYGRRIKFGVTKQRRREKGLSYIIPLCQPALRFFDKVCIRALANGDKRDRFALSVRSFVT